VPLSSVNRIQAKSGTFGVAGAGVSSIPVTLDNPTADGSTLVVYFAQTGTVTTPDAGPPWAKDIEQVVTQYIFRRSGVPAGETSWTFAFSPNSVGCWRAEEWTALDLVDAVDATATATATSSATPASGTATTDVTDFVALGFIRASKSSGGTTFPAGRSWSAGFTETDYVPNGTGTTTGDIMLATAEAYPGAAGNVTATLTFDTTGGGAFSNLGEYGAIVCYRADTPQPGDTVLTAAPPA
jgi:hypothetical protein